MVGSTWAFSRLGGAFEALLCGLSFGLALLRKELDRLGEYLIDHWSETDTRLTCTDQPHDLHACKNSLFAVGPQWAEWWSEFHV